jgi:hypothetical protein
MPTLPCNICDAKPAFDALATMLSRGGRWAAYRNVEIGHRDLGHLKFLRVGEGCTFQDPPQRLPDTPREINWRYLFVGFVNLATGEIEKVTP